MRVLLATDGSEAAGVGIKLARSASWPEETTVRVITAVETGRALPLERAVAEALATTEPATQRNDAAPIRVGEAEPLTSLTRRELDVLRLIAAGLSDREISDQLSISIRTATTHVTNILAKLGVPSRAAAAAIAAREHLV